MPNTPYNLSDVTSQTNLFDVATATNTLVDGLFGQLILMVSFIILFLTFKRFDTARAFAASSYITTVLAILLRIMGWLGDAWMFGAMLLSGIAFVILRFS